ncbi:uncharacterized protein LOC124122402 isoform X2 [Haliotis rufescens]|uniref:uncharacterized protein LOC124122402 isoform X2 n=2 Tax=Haliotis rufescens TaxID=6454 RepID=UPI00201ED3D7|nr:uncharacterized protein LOC124122402 isoform X2 [Haliotis rufescens]
MHSYCRECLKDLHSKSKTDVTSSGRNKVTCPDCRGTTLLGPDGVDGLQKNFIVANIAAKFKETSLVDSTTCPTSSTPRLEVHDQSHGKKTQSVYCLACAKVIKISDEQNSTHCYHVTQDLETTISQKRAKLSTCIKELSKGRTHEGQKLQAATAEHGAIEEDMSKQQNMIESLEDILKTRKVEVLDRFETLKRQNDASLTDYQQHVKAYISTVDTISASARALDEQCLGEEDGLATFIQIADDIMTQICQIPETTKYSPTFIAPPNGERERIAKELVDHLNNYCGIGDQTPSSEAMLVPCTQVNREAMPKIVGVENVPSCAETAKVIITWSSTQTQEEYKVKCSTRTGLGIVKEDFEAIVIGDSFEMDGLRFKTDYVASIRPSIMSSTSDTDVHNFTTADRIFGGDFHFDNENCHPDLAVSWDTRTVTSEKWKHKEINGCTRTNHGDWTKVYGIASTLIFRSGCQYWEILVMFTVLRHLKDNDVITSIGICKEGKEDSYEPLCGSFYSLCCTLFKQPRNSAIAIDFWDGQKKVTSEETPIGHLKRGKPQSLKLGFYLDLNSKVFKIINVEKNSVLHTFDIIKFDKVTAVASIDNEEKVRTSLELDSYIDTVPSSLYH